MKWENPCLNQWYQHSNSRQNLQSHLHAFLQLFIFKRNITLSLIITTKGSSFIITCHKQPEEIKNSIDHKISFIVCANCHLFRFDYVTQGGLARLCTLTASLFIQVYKWIAVNCCATWLNTARMQVACDGLSSHPAGVAIFLAASIAKELGVEPFKLIERVDPKSLSPSSKFDYHTFYHCARVKGDEP